MNLTEKTLSSKVIYQGKVVTLRVDEAELSDGTRVGREVVEHSGGVCVAALTGQNELLMVRQFRYPYGEVVCELPAGKREKGEDPLACGKRELLEETGVSGAEFLELGKLYPSPGYCGEIIWMFAAKNLTFGDSRPDEGEFLEVERIPLEKAVNMVMAGEIVDAKTATAVLKLAELRRQGKF